MGSRPPQPTEVAQSSTPGSASSTASSKKPFFRQVNKRTIIIPTLACLLFIYGYTSINAAKSNAQRHRDADTGGEGLSLLNESRRRHGMDKRLEGGGNTVTELASAARAQLLGEKNKSDDQPQESVGTGRSENEEKLRAMRRTRPSSREG